MKRRIGLWALAGFVVAWGWFFLMSAIAPASALRLQSSRLFWAVAEITAPASLLRHFPTKYYWFIVVNALIYGLVGLGIELLRRRSLRPAPGH